MCGMGLGLGLGLLGRSMNTAAYGALLLGHGDNPDAAIFSRNDWEDDLLALPSPFIKQYRIPVTANKPCANGDLLAMAEARIANSDEKCFAIVMRRSTDKGKTWGAFEVMVHDGNYAESTPPTATGHHINLGSLTISDTGRVHLVYLVRRNTGGTTAGFPDDPADMLTYHIRSVDNGVTWTESDGTARADNEWDEGTDISAATRYPASLDAPFGVTGNTAWPFFVVGPSNGCVVSGGANDGRIIIGAYH